MYGITSRQLSELRRARTPYCVTLYVPLAKRETTDNSQQVGYRGLLRNVERALSHDVKQPEEVTAMLKPAYDLVGTPEFRAARNECMAIFIRPGKLQYFRLPDAAIDKSMSIGERFDLKPLEHELKRNKQYLLLLISHHGATLFAGDHYTLRRQSLPGIEEGMAQALRIDEYPKARELHPIAPATAGKQSHAYHQQYNTEDTDKTMLVEYFRRIDSRLKRALRDDHRPLVLAGVGYLLPMYRQVNTYPYVTAGELDGNFEHIPQATLRERAWKLITSKMAT